MATILFGQDQDFPSGSAPSPMNRLHQFAYNAPFLVIPVLLIVRMLMFPIAVTRGGVDAEKTKRH
jgi:hypothetical protein